jgi:aminoglycoside phosphotransferase
VNGKFEESPSKEHGVAGLFIFHNKSALIEVPETGELVRFLHDKQYKFKPLGLNGTKEIGSLNKLKAESDNGGFRCRAFNEIKITNGKITKIPIDSRGRDLAIRELAWYKEAQRLHFMQIPDILSFEPFTMRLINGKNIFRAELDDNGKKIVIDNIVASLENLHSLGKIDCDCFSLKEAYYTKTMNRLDKVRNLIPFSENKVIIINGKKCKNIYFHRDEFRSLVERILYNTHFAFIHGDCTFSNSMVDDKLNITFLDPRGYFGYTDIYGDTAYDWAKVFYSINGDYDQFNNGNFSLDIGENNVILNIETNGWQHLSSYYLSKIPDCPQAKILFIHAIIWLSLTTYAWEDYDSICGAFYKGLLLLNEFLGAYNE